MSRKIKILFIYRGDLPYDQIPAFVKNDIELLKKYFDVKLFLFAFKKIFSLPFQIQYSDIVFIWFADYYAFITTLFARIIRKPIVIVTGGYDLANVKEVKYGLMQYSIFRRMVRYILCHASKVLAVSEFNKREIERYVEIDTAVVMYNSVDVNYFVPIGNKENIVLTVTSCGNWERIRLKGSDMFTESARFLPNVKFFVVGLWGTALKKLQKIAPPNVTLIGYLSQDELIAYYQKAKVYCQLSYYESCGIALEEAMSCGCVPVVTNRGALPEVVGDTGFVTKYGEIDEIVEAIKQSLNDDKKGMEGRKRVIENFSLEKREKELKEVIQGLIR